jgi:hypothetical protein
MGGFSAICAREGCVYAVATNTASTEGRLLRKLLVFMIGFLCCSFGDETVSQFAI